MTSQQHPQQVGFSLKAWAECPHLLLWLPPLQPQNTGSPPAWGQPGPPSVPSVQGKGCHGALIYHLLSSRPALPAHHQGLLPTCVGHHSAPPSPRSPWQSIIPVFLLLLLQLSLLWWWDVWGRALSQPQVAPCGVTGMLGLRRHPGPSNACDPLSFLIPLFPAQFPQQVRGAPCIPSHPTSSHPPRIPLHLAASCPTTSHPVPPHPTPALCPSCCTSHPAAHHPHPIVTSCSPPDPSSSHYIPLHPLESHLTPPHLPLPPFLGTAPHSPTPPRTTAACPRSLRAGRRTGSAMSPWRC